jgi:nitrate/nitrite transporter NarK
MLQVRFGLSNVEAGDMFGYIYAISGIVLITVGYYSDRYGNLALMQILAACCSVMGNLWWSYHSTECAKTSDCSREVLVPICVMGLAYGLMAGTVWNSIIYLIAQSSIGRVMGLMAAANNVGLIVTPIIFGELKDYAPHLDQGYYYVTRLSTTIAIVGLLLACVIFGHDLWLNDSVLQMSVD